MPREISDGQLLLLDACCLINLLATERAGQILEVIPYRCAVPRFVAENEVFRLGPANPEEEDQRISTAEVTAIAGLEILEIESPIEIAELVRFAGLLDDGEANACALAVARHGGVATDDRKALAVLTRLVPRVPILQTSEILFEGIARHRWTDLEVHRMLRSIRDRARFVPRRGAPYFDWWTKLLGGT